MALDYPGNCFVFRWAGATDNNGEASIHARFLGHRAFLLLAVAARSRTILSRCHAGTGSINHQNGKQKARFMRPCFLLLATSHTRVCLVTLRLFSRQRRYSNYGYELGSQVISLVVVTPLILRRSGYCHCILILSSRCNKKHRASARFRCFLFGSSLAISSEDIAELIKPLSDGTANAGTSQATHHNPREKAGQHIFTGNGPNGYRSGAGLGPATFSLWG